MPANFNDNFWTENGLQLRRPSLNCLRLDSMTYRTLLFQLNEEIGFDQSGIWLVNQERSKLKFDSFFDLAIQQNVDLAVTPEYSCPWVILGNLLLQEKFPTHNNLWVLGMASINPVNLKQFIVENENITWIYDHQLLEDNVKTSPHKFFDPVCYVLNTQDRTGSNKKVIVIQFKNYPFGGADAYWERDNIILGRTFYVIKNQFESARLVTLICSDTLDNLNFNEVQDGMFLTAPLLLLHIQLNQKPFADNYKLYRNVVFLKGDKDGNKEVICLNWARNVHYKSEGNPQTFNDIAGSAYYLKSTKLYKSDHHINANHKGGMYYTNWSAKRTHVYLLNFDEYVYLIENTKVSQAEADPTQYNRTGPRLQSTYSWQENIWTIESNRIDDGFIQMISELEHEEGSLNCLSLNENYIEVERMIQLCSGEIAFDREWFTVSNMLSFVIDDTEANDRVMLNQQNIEVKVTARKRKINNYSILKHGIVNNSANLPVGMNEAELKYIDIADKNTKYLLNLHSKDGSMHATAIYVGTMPKNEAFIVQKKVSDLFNNSQYGKTVMVWHETVNGKQRIPPEFVTPKISESIDKKSNQYTQKGKI